MAIATTTEVPFMWTVLWLATAACAGLYEHNPLATSFRSDEVTGLMLLQTVIEGVQNLLPSAGAT